MSKPEVSCPICMEPILAADATAYVPHPFADPAFGLVQAHEHCVDAETAMAADLYDPAEDYPHGDY